jgi:uncharacterized protein YndB with AHSA1/START domain
LLLVNEEVMSKTISRSHSSEKTPLKRANTPKQVSTPKEVPALKKMSSDKQTAITRPAAPTKPEAYVVRQSVELKALPSEVWDALTNPDKTKKYFFNCEVSSDWKAGSPITFKGKLFLIIPIELKGEIVKVEPGKLLKYRLHNKKTGNKPASTSTVTDTLSYSNGTTTLSITDDVGAGEGAEVRYKKSVEGWNKILINLKKLIENGKL